PTSLILDKDGSIHAYDSHRRIERVGAMSTKWSRPASAAADAGIFTLSEEDFSSEMETTVSEESPSRLEQWRARLLRFRAPALRVALFALGVAAAFAALLLYQALFPAPRPLTTRDVNTSIAQPFAS